MLIKKRLLRGLGVTDARVDKYLPDLNKAFSKHQIDNSLRIAHFLAQILHESARLRYVKENLNYSSQALLKLFRKYFTPSQAQVYARKPEMIGNRVYANRMGNGDEASGDGAPLIDANTVRGGDTAVLVTDSSRANIRNNTFTDQNFGIGVSGRAAPAIDECVTSLCQLADERLAKRVRRR